MAQMCLLPKVLSPGAEAEEDTRQGAVKALLAVQDPGRAGRQATQPSGLLGCSPHLPATPASQVLAPMAPSKSPLPLSALGHSPQGQVLRQSQNPEAGLHGYSQRHSKGHRPQEEDGVLPTSGAATTHVHMQRRKNPAGNLTPSQSQTPEWETPHVLKDTADELGTGAGRENEKSQGPERKRPSPQMHKEHRGPGGRQDATA